MLYVLDRSDHKKLRTIYGNDKAASVTGGGQPNYPYGSVMVLETWSALKDADANTMRKEKGFGAAYGAARNGEREYVGYTLARAFSTAPQNSALSPPSWSRPYSGRGRSGYSGSRAGCHHQELRLCP